MWGNELAHFQYIDISHLIFFPPSVNYTSGQMDGFTFICLSGSGYLFSGSRPASLYKDSPPSGIKPYALRSAVLHPFVKLDGNFPHHIFVVVCFRLLLTEVREPPVLAGPLSCTLGGWLRYLQFRLCQTAAPPHQPCSPQHQRPKAAAVLDGPRALPHVPTHFPITPLHGAELLGLQWLLFTWHIPLPKPKWYIKAAEEH